MDVLILYESLTGNTEFGVEVIKLVLEKLGHGCTVRRYRETAPGEIGSHDLYCFATPILNCAPMASVWAFMHRLPTRQGAPAFIFSTRGGYPGVAHTLIALELQKHGFAIIGNHYLTCETSFPVLRSVFGRFYRSVDLPTKRSLLKLVEFTGEMAVKAQMLQAGLPVDLPRFSFLPGLTLPFALYAVRGGLRNTIGRRTVDMDKCNLCGICALTCPVSAITLDKELVFNSSCIGCWGCFNTCPRAAIRTNIVGPANYYSGIKNKESKIKAIGLHKRD